MKLLSIFAAFLAAIFFGISTPISKLLIASLNPFQLAGLLYLGAGIGLLPFQFFSKKNKETMVITGTNLKRIIGMVFFGGILGPILLLFGLRLASSSSVSLWLSFESFATALIGFFLFKDHLGKLGWIAIAMSVILNILLSVNEGSSGIIAGLFILGASVAWGFDNHFSATIDGITPSKSTIIKGFIAGTTNFFIGTLISKSMPLFTLIISALLLGFIAYGISILLYILAAQNIGAVRSQIIFSSSPYFGLFFSILLINEKIAFLQIVAALLLLISILLILFDRHTHEHIHESMEHVHLHSHNDKHHHTHSHGEVLAKQKKHTHLHRHEALVHRHPHWPDLHHRHSH